MPDLVSNTLAMLSDDVADMAVPGVIVEVSPATADAMGAFREDALSEADAWEANADLTRIA